MITAEGWRSPRSCRATCKPFRPGRLMSRTMTSGLSLRASSSASLPSAPSPTTAMSGSLRSTSRNPCRKRGWSSTKRTLILSMMSTRHERNSASACVSQYSKKPNHTQTRSLYPPGSGPAWPPVHRHVRAPGGRAKRRMRAEDFGGGERRHQPGIPVWKGNEIVRARGRQPIAQSRLVPNNGNDLGRNQSGHVEDIPPAKVSERADVVRRDERVRRRVLVHPPGGRHHLCFDDLHIAPICLRADQPERRQPQRRRRQPCATDYF